MKDLLLIPFLAVLATQLAVNGWETAAIIVIFIAVYQGRKQGRAEMKRTLLEAPPDREAVRKVLADMLGELGPARRYLGADALAVAVFRKVEEARRLVARMAQW